MPMHRRISLLLLPLVLGLSSPGWAAPEYRVTVVAPAGSAASDINCSGVVVGRYAYSPTTTHGFLNRGSGLVDLGPLHGSASEAVALNDKGQVLGHWTSAAGVRRGFIYYHGVARDIGAIPGRLTDFTDINNNGYITANGVIADFDEGQHGFLRAPDGSYRDIGALPYDNPMTITFALNKSLQIVGASGPLTFPEQPLRAFGWNAGSMRDLGDFGFTPNYGEAINELGQVTGTASLPTGFHNRKAFLYSYGRMVDIDGRPDTGVDRWSEGRGINNRGHVVGNSNHLSGFIYRGRRMQSLNALIDPALGWNIQYPEAINDAGQIAATAFRGRLQFAVRLDLIRPAAEAPLVLDEDAALTEQDKADAAAEAQAQAREVVVPVKQ